MFFTSSLTVTHWLFSSLMMSPTWTFIHFSLRSLKTGNRLVSGWLDCVFQYVCTLPTLSSNLSKYITTRIYTSSWRLSLRNAAHAFQPVFIDKPTSHLYCVFQYLEPSSSEHHVQPQEAAAGRCGDLVLEADVCYLKCVGHDWLVQRFESCVGLFLAT